MQKAWAVTLVSRRSIVWLQPKSVLMWLCMGLFGCRLRLGARSIRLDVFLCHRPVREDIRPLCHVGSFDKNVSPLEVKFDLIHSIEVLGPIDESLHGRHRILICSRTDHSFFSTSVDIQRNNVNVQQPEYWMNDCAVWVLRQVHTSRVLFSPFACILAYGDIYNIISSTSVYVDRQKRKRERKKNKTMRFIYWYWRRITGIIRHSHSNKRWTLFRRHIILILY
jgi:hypothetical protein